MEKLELARLRADLKSVTSTEFFLKGQEAFILTYLNPLLETSQPTRHPIPQQSVRQWRLFPEEAHKS